MDQVRLEMAKEEMEETRQGSIQAHDVSPNIFLQLGLELEEQQ